MKIGKIGFDLNSDSTALVITAFCKICQICQIWPNMVKYANIVKWGVPEKILQNTVQTRWSRVNRTLQSRIMTKSHFWPDRPNQVIPSKYALKVHTDIHKGLDYPCKQCSHIFKTSKYLEEHERKLHNAKNSGERSTCNVCQKSFRSDSLKKTPHSSRAFKRSTLFMQNLLRKICIAVHAEYAHERQTFKVICFRAINSRTQT